MSQIIFVDNFVGKKWMDILILIIVSIFYLYVEIHNKNDISTLPVKEKKYNTRSSID